MGWYSTAARRPRSCSACRQHHRVNQALNRFWTNSVQQRYPLRLKVYSLAMSQHQRPACCPAASYRSQIRCCAQCSCNVDRPHDGRVVLSKQSAPVCRTASRTTNTQKKLHGAAVCPKPIACWQVAPSLLWKLGLRLLPMDAQLHAWKGTSPPAFVSLTSDQSAIGDLRVVYALVRRCAAEFSVFGAPSRWIL
jgi:hypothetical protein